MLRALLFFAILFAVSALNAQTINLVAKPTNIRFGEQVDVLVQCQLNQSQKSKGFQITDSISSYLNGLEMVSPIKVDTNIEGDKSFVYNYDFKFKISGFDSGRFELGPIPFVNGGDSVFSNSVFINVYPVPLDSAATPKPIKSNAEIPITALDYVKVYGPYGLIPILVGVGIFFLLRYLRNRRINKEFVPEIMVEPEVPAHEEALSALQKLLKDKAWQQSGEKWFYTQITQITRTYLQKRYRIRALEQTSGEIINGLQYKIRNKAMLEDLSEILNIADMVKFAKEKPDAEFGKDAVNKAIELVEKTKEISVKQEENHG